jgi:hypothetical protein
MQILEIDWQWFLDDVPPFQRLPREARRLFMGKVRPSQPISSFELGKYFEVCRASGCNRCPEHRKTMAEPVTIEGGLVDVREAARL